MRWAIAAALLITVRSSAQERLFVSEASVLTPETVRLKTSDGIDIYFLYGVSSLGSSSRTQGEAKQFISDRINPRKAKFYLVASKGGLHYVRVESESGEVLNEELLLKGLIKLDVLSAGTDERYGQLQQQAKNAKTGLWRQEHGVSEVSQESGDEPAKSETRLDSEAFLLKRELTELAEFEAAYVKWSRLSEEQRHQMLSHFYGMANRVEKGSAEFLDSREGSVRGHVNTLNSTDSAILQQRQFVQWENEAEGATLAEVYDDFDLKWNLGMRDSFYEDMATDAIVGDLYSLRINSSLANKYNVKVSRDLNRVNQNAAAVSNVYETRREKHYRALQSLASRRADVQRSPAPCGGVSKCRNTNCVQSRSSHKRDNKSDRIT